MSNDIKFCYKCGANIPEGSAFCPECGSRLDGRGTNEVEIYPLKLLVPTIRLISKKDVRTFIRGVWDER